MPGPTARERIERELRADAARSDHLISEITGSPWHRIGAIRHRLEAGGEIPVVPVSRRAVTMIHGSIARGRLRVTDRPGAGFYRVDDAVDLPCCVAEWSGGAFTHARSCPFRRQAASR